MHSTQIPGNLAEGETVQEFRIPAPKHTPGPWTTFGTLTRYVEARIAGGVVQEIAAVGPTAADRGYGEQQAANACLIAQAPTLLQDLIYAAAQLRKYETLHRAKGTPDSLEKAEVNAALAARFEATIAAAVGGAE